MNKILRNVLLVLAIAALAILLYRWLFPPSEEVARLRRRIDRALEAADSLRAVNDTLRSEINELRRVQQVFEARIDSIRRVADDRQNRLRQLERLARLFPGTPDSLHRELNRLARTPLLVSPD
jgi:Tfp pilus assembly protein PilN